jgi:EAL domain-containing protein (putative c-di-GMP-specific phosphodiesterase class I)
VAAQRGGDLAAAGPLAGAVEVPRDPRRIDDFGTGYSSLSYLHRFPVDILKIDRLFVERLSRMSDSAELARTVVRLGQSLQLVTVAEGVEDHAQFLALPRMGCDIGQGFYFGRPTEAEETERFLAEEPAVAKAPS